MPEQNDAEWFQELRQKRIREAAKALESAKLAAHASGKEIFDLELLYASWPWNPDARDESRGHFTPLQDRLKEWETMYYRRFPDIRTMAEFTDRMKKLQGHGCFD